jgi:hypothetical protein
LKRAIPAATATTKNSSETSDGIASQTPYTNDSFRREEAACSHSNSLNKLQAALQGITVPD